MRHTESQRQRDRKLHTLGKERYTRKGRERKRRKQRDTEGAGRDGDRKTDSWRHTGRGRKLYSDRYKESERDRQKETQAHK